ncbi:acyltransferase family protein [Micrococcus sp.]|uniref:acyltransferase family protein n=1 Tax=Micrococcus sp. TaxID=1271 RepID=UPI002A90CFE2|nr:acyltransferase family protein [Micrococcus sp.]MDY6056153.1 acyltransferase family protein [Micrococcus sp.]
MKNKKRHVGLDALRVLAVFLVVVGHSGGPAVIHEFIYGWHVPLFFFLSGWFYSPGRTLGDELRKRWETIGRPYIVWLVIIGAVYVCAELLRDEMKVGDLLRLVWGGSRLAEPFSAFWFMSALFVAALIYRWGRESNRSKLLILVAAGMYLAAYAFPRWVALLPGSVGMGVVCLLFIAGGEWSRRHVPEAGLLSPVPWIAMGVPSLAWISGALPPLDLKYGQIGLPVLSFLASLAFCWGITVAFSRLEIDAESRLGGAVTTLSHGGTGVVFLHPVLLWVGLSSALPWPLGPLVVTVVCWVAVTVAAASPLLDFFLLGGQRGRGGLLPARS